MGERRRFAVEFLLRSTRVILTRVAAPGARVGRTAAANEAGRCRLSALGAPFQIAIQDLANSHADERPSIPRRLIDLEIMHLSFLAAERDWHAYASAFLVDFPDGGLIWNIEILYRSPSGRFAIQRLPVRSFMLNTILSRANDMERSPGPRVANDRWIS
jgi:hypothetical protein